MSNSAHRITQVIPQPACTDNASAVSVSPSVAWSLEGKKIGRYELIYRIASGGMASVYAARLTGMAGFVRLVAIKVIHPHLTLEPAFIQMFQDEARLAARISHPNVAEIYELGESDGIYYMAVELVRGKDLNQILAQSSQKRIALPLRFMVDVIRQICDGLSETHHLTGANGEPLHLIHRDVSTRNILVSYSGRPKLIDFGAAWAKDRLTHTATGHIKGKIGYMPPEQIRGETLDHRADIYSLGVVLYTAATACHPFPYDNEAQQITHTLNGNFPRPSKMNLAVDPQLERIILTAMALSPADRFSSADVMGQHLEHWLAHHDSAAARPAARIMQSLFADEIKKEKQQLEKPKNRFSRPSGHPWVAQHNSLSRRRAIVLSTVALTAVISAGLTGLTWWYQSATDSEGPNTPPGTDVTHSASPAFQGVPQGDDLAAEQPSPAPQTVFVHISGAMENATFRINGRQVSNPIALPWSNTTTAVQIRAPGYQEQWVHVVPNGDITIAIDKAQPVESRREPAARLPRHADNDCNRTRSHISKPLPVNETGPAPVNAPLAFESNPFEPNAANADPGRDAVK